MNQVGTLRILIWHSIRTRDDIHPRIDQLHFVGDFYAGNPAVFQDAGVDQEKFALMGCGCG